MSYRRFAIALVASSLGLATVPTLGLAQGNPVEDAAKAIAGQAPGQEDHIGQAVSHTREAIGAGADQSAAALTEHASAALEHAKAAQAATPNKHTKMGIKHLEQAVRHGKMGHAKVAKKHAEQALTHLTHAQETGGK